MSLVGFVKSYWIRWVRAWLMWRLRNTPARISLERSNWEQSLRDPTGFYLECVRYFQQQLPAELKAHRAYFYNVAGNRRGFGEDAFHVMWKGLLKEFKPGNFLEIGVFRGQVVSLVSLCSRLNGVACEVWGISQFSGAGDSGSKYPQGFNYYQDTLENFEHFGLPHPRLLRASSTDPEALQLIASRPWEMIYIDGNHDYEIVLRDWEACSTSLKRGGIIVLDDSGITDAYRPPIFATSGCPGPSKLAREIDRTRFREILQVGHNRVFQKVR